MYLRQIEIAGFKSFGGRIKVDLHTGIVGVVGPNGAGKSNIADAIRWVLGEQSTKTLRLRRGDELIFAGGVGRKRASMAEVSLVFDNSDGAAPIDFTEVALTRRLYRSGESEYLLNGGRVRLSDIQMLLARSGFGTGYTIIAQGMIDQLLMASPAERKALFVEASGIKALELDRASHQKKISKSQLNLETVEHSIAELVPQQVELGNLLAQRKARQTILGQLHQARQTYLSQQSIWLNRQSAELSTEIASIQKKMVDLNDKQVSSRRELDQLTSQASSLQAQARQDGQALAEAEKKRDKVIARLAELVVKRDNYQQSQHDLASIKADLTSQLAKTVQQQDKLNNNIAKLSLELKSEQSKLNDYDTKLKQINKEQSSIRNQMVQASKSRYLHHALGLVKNLNDNLLKKPTDDPAQLKLILHKLARFLRLAIEQQPDELPAQLSRLQASANRLMTQREEHNEKLTTKIIRLRAYELDLSACELELVAQQAQLAKLEREIAETPTHDSVITKLTGQRDELDRSIKQLRRGLLSGQQSRNSVKLQTINDDLQSIVAKKAALENSLQGCEQKLSDLATTQKELDNLQVHWSVTLATKVSRETVGLSEINRLEGELAMIAEIDSDVGNKAAALEAQLTFLQTQVSDLSQAISGAQLVITRLDKKIKQQFEVNFAKINTQFNAYFTKLFAGGNAELVLNQIDESEFGIEIMVQPPNQRASALGVLSGGQKALSSIALLTAIISVNPSPFILLDEVDAALDELNSVKFGQILQTIAEHTQVLVITHNHQTMQVADELMGVTSDDTGSSSILAVQLGTARAMSH